jgi:hypothetical protein
MKKKTIHERTRNYSNKNYLRAVSGDFVDRFLFLSSLPGKAEHNLWKFL